MKRTFLAIKVSDHARELIAEIYNDLPELQNKVKIANPENPHITVKFLGDTEENKIQDITQDLEQTLDDIPKFGFEMANTGVFPDRSRPSVLWLGIDKGEERLKELHDKVEDVTEKYGISRENREFIPHLTIGRTKKRKKIKNIDEFLSYSFKPIFNKAEELIFFEST